jgi:hypothetical protein
MKAPSTTSRRFPRSAADELAGAACYCSARAWRALPPRLTTRGGRGLTDDVGAALAAILHLTTLHNHY